MIKFLYGRINRFHEGGEKMVGIDNPTKVRYPPKYTIIAAR